MHKHDTAIAMTNGNRRFCHDLIEAGRKAERDRIAAWLRSLTEVNVGQFVGTLQYLADNIEAGEHLK